MYNTTIAICFGSNSPAVERHVRAVQVTVKEITATSVSHRIKVINYLINKSVVLGASCLNYYVMTFHRQS